MAVFQRQDYDSIVYSIECDLEDALFDTHRWLADECGVEPCDRAEFHETYWQSCMWGELRDVALAILEQAGIEIRAED